MQMDDETKIIWSISTACRSVRELVEHSYSTLLNDGFILYNKYYRQILQDDEEMYVFKFKNKEHAKFFADNFIQMVTLKNVKLEYDDDNEVVIFLD